MTFYELLKNIIDKLSFAVRVDEQNLSDDKKAQARANIGAASDIDLSNVRSEKSQVQIITWEADD